jgi:HK97 family phage major capsid protein
MIATATAPSPDFTLGQLCRAAFVKERPDLLRGSDARLLDQIKAAAGSDENTTLSDPAGGFLIPTEHKNDLLNRGLGVSKMAKRCTQFTIKGRRAKFGMVQETSRVDQQRQGGIVSTFQEETQAAPTGRPAFKQLSLEMNRITIIIFATEEMVADVQALDNWIKLMAGEEIGIKLDTTLLLGSGVGEPAGLMNSPALITIAKDNEQTAATISATNITGMIGRLWPYSDERAAFFCSRSAEQAILNDDTIWHLLKFRGPDADQSAPRVSIAGVPLIVT